MLHGSRDAHSGDSAHLSPMWPELDSVLVPYLYVSCVVVGSCLAQRVFVRQLRSQGKDPGNEVVRSGTLVFLSFQKSTSSNSNLTRVEDPH